MFLSIRSKTVILAKNLPARTAVEELRDMFARHGDLARVVLPPNGGVTALVEFLEASLLWVIVMRVLNWFPSKCYRVARMVVERVLSKVSVLFRRMEGCNHRTL